MDNQFRNSVNGLPNNGTEPASTPAETTLNKTESEKKTTPAGAE